MPSSNAQSSGGNYLEMNMTPGASSLWTIWFWYKVNNWDKGGTPFGIIATAFGFDSPNQTGVGFIQDATGDGTANNVDAFRYRGDTGFTSIANDVLTASGTWAFGCMVLNGTSATMYTALEGGSISSASTTLNFNASTLVTMYLAGAGAQYADISIYGVGAATRAYNSTEVAAQRASPGAVVDATGLFSFILCDNNLNPEDSSAGVDWVRTGTFTSDASIPVIPGGAYTLVAQTGAFTLTGNNANLTGPKRITHINAATHSGNPTTSGTITIPTTAVGDTLILAAVNGGATAAPSVTDDDTGGNAWTRIDSGTDGLSVWSKRSTSGTSAKTVTVSGMTNSMSAGLSVFRDVGRIAGSPIEQLSSESNASGNESHAAVTPTRPNSWICLVVGNRTNDNSVTSPAATTPSVITQRFQGLSTGGNDTGVFFGAAERGGSAGSSGTITWAQTDATTLSRAFALVPALDYTLVAQTGSFALSGQNAGLLRRLFLTMTSGSFALSGSDANLTPSGSGSPTLVAQSGSFGVTGQSAGLFALRRLTSQTGAFALTGISAAMLRAVRLVSQVGAFSLTGQSAGLFASRRLTSQTGAFTLTGQVAGLLRRLFLTSATGSFALTGQSASFNLTHRLTAQTGAFTFAGLSATLLASRRLTAQTGAFTLTGNSATFLRSIILAATRGQFSLTGVDANLRAARRLISQTGSFALTGNGAGIFASRRLTAQAGSFVLDGHDAGMTNTRALLAQPGAFAVSGSAAALAAARVFTVARGEFTVTGNDAEFTAAGRVLSVLTGAFAVTGSSAGLTASRRLVAQAGSFATSGIDAVLSPLRILHVVTGEFTTAGQAASFFRSLRLAAGHGAFALAPTSSNLIAAKILSAGHGSFALSGGDAEIDVVQRALYAQAGAFAVDGAAAQMRVARVIIAASASFSVTGGSVVLTYRAFVVGVSPGAIGMVEPGLEELEMDARELSRLGMEVSRLNKIDM